MHADELAIMLKELTIHTLIAWCCLVLNFTQFVIFENLSILDLALSGVKGLSHIDAFFFTVHPTRLLSFD